MPSPMFVIKSFLVMAPSKSGTAEMPRTIKSSAGGKGSIVGTKGNLFHASGCATKYPSKPASTKPPITEPPIRVKVFCPSTNFFHLLSS